MTNELNVYDTTDRYDLLLRDLGWCQVGTGVLWTPPGESNKTVYRRKEEALDLVIAEILREDQVKYMGRYNALECVRTALDLRNAETCSKCHGSKDGNNMLHQLKLINKELRQALINIIDIAERKHSRKKAISTRATEALDFTPPEYY